ncbi:hypothetical protein MNBD_GAMMA10-1113 [hydrothermal vent metagenome]|uniref:Uncharacterized protein n=1 Tax=hydrothermal vent metagenome TaxID=652676 RepID=A0A3B0YN19_9ZZZZ
MQTMHRIVIEIRGIYILLIDVEPCEWLPVRFNSTFQYITYLFSWKNKLIEVPWQSIMRTRCFLDV